MVTLHKNKPNKFDEVNIKMEIVSCNSDYFGRYLACFNVYQARQIIMSKFGSHWVLQTSGFALN